MSKFRKKPVVIEAVQFLPPTLPAHHYDFPQRVPERAGFDFEGLPVNLDELGYFLLIPTLEGTHRANAGDWIITGIKGERYPCKPDIFAATYVPVDEDGNVE